MRKFRLRSIKSFEDSGDIEIKPITILVGKNSCGKSSILRFPAVLAQTFKEDVATPLLLFGNMSDYGNFDDVINNHCGERFGFSLEFGEEIRGQIARRLPVLTDSETFNVIRKRISNTKSVKVEVQIAKPNRKMLVDEIRLYVDDKSLFELIRKEAAYETVFSNIMVEKGKQYKISLSLAKVSFDRFFPIFDADEVVEQFMKVNNLPEKEKVQDILRNLFYMSIEDRQAVQKQEWYELLEDIYVVNAYLRGCSYFLKNEARKMSYIGPFRENPKRIYRDSESRYSDVGVRGENSGMLLRQASQGTSGLLAKVSSWFSKAMGYEIDIQDIESSLYNLVVKSHVKNRDGSERDEIDNLIDVGYGISQVLPIVTALYDKGNLLDNPYGVNKRMFLLEQPELHLHPAAQAELADLLVECIIENKSRRIFLETHSEHLIRKLQVLIADSEYDFHNDQVVIYYVDKDEKGYSHVKKMNVLENGQFEEEWPSGFFDKSYELATQLLYSGLKKN